MDMVFSCKNSSVGELFWHFRIYGYDFQTIFRFYGYTFEINFSGLMGILFEKILRIYGWYFYDLNDTTQYLGDSSDPTLG